MSRLSEITPFWSATRWWCSSLLFIICIVASKTVTLAAPPLQGSLSTSDIYRGFNPLAGEPEIMSSDSQNKCIPPVPAQVSDSNLRTHWQVVRQIGDTCDYWAPFVKRAPGSLVSKSQMTQIEARNGYCEPDPFDASTFICQAPPPAMRFNPAGMEQQIPKPNCAKGPPGAYDPSSNPECETIHTGPAPQRAELPNYGPMPVPNVGGRQTAAGKPAIEATPAQAPVQKRTWVYGRNSFDCPQGGKPCTFVDSLGTVWEVPRFVDDHGLTYLLDERSFHFERFVQNNVAYVTPSATYTLHSVPSGVDRRTVKTHLTRSDFKQL